MYYLVTGVTTDGVGFRMRYESRRQALGINLYRGNVWMIAKNGKRKLIKRVWN